MAQPMKRGAMVAVTFCNGTYHRLENGWWTYFWGEPVPGAKDLTLVEALVQHRFAEAPPARDHLTEDELRWACGLGRISAPVVVDGHESGREVVVGMTAPELNVLFMLTVADVAEAASVSKATIDSYRYRGHLPEPQIVKSRTPLWTRPVIRHWLDQRPGPGWRTDVHGHPEPRA